MDREFVFPLIYLGNMRSDGFLDVSVLRLWRWAKDLKIDSSTKYCNLRCVMTTLTILVNTISIVVKPNSVLQKTVSALKMKEQ